MIKSVRINNNPNCLRKDATFDENNSKQVEADCGSKNPVGGNWVYPSEDQKRECISGRTKLLKLNAYPTTLAMGEQRIESNWCSGVIVKLDLETDRGNYTYTWK